MSNIMDDDAIRPSVKQIEDALAKQQVIPPDQAAQEELDKILDMVTDGCVVPSYIAESKAKAKAALLALMYRETLAIADEIEKVNDSNGRYNACVEFREAAATRYGQIGSEG